MNHQDRVDEASYLIRSKDRDPYRGSLIKDKRLLFKPMMQNIYFLSFVFSMMLFIVAARGQTSHERSVTRAEELIAKDQIVEAIKVYEVALSEFISRSDQHAEEAEVGKIHSRLGQLYLKRMLNDGRSEHALEFRTQAAYHYLKCVRVSKLSSIIRERICAPKVSQLTAPLNIIGIANELKIIHPRAFRGPTANGQFVPRGLLSIEYRIKATRTLERRLIRIPQDRPLDFTERNYMPPRPLLGSAKGLVLAPAPNSEDYKAYMKALKPVKIPLFPGILMGSAGIGGLITGSILQGLDLNTPMGDEGNKAFFIAGGVLTALGTSWLIWAI